MSKSILAAAALAFTPLAFGCSGPTSSQTSGPLVEQAHPNVPGTVFTIVFENEDATNVLTSEAPFFLSLSKQYGLATAYTSSTHPSLPNYIVMTSGSTNGVTNDNDPTAVAPIFGSQNIAAQLDTAQVPWRAYMESMGDACTMTSNGLYSAHHDPFLYYDYISGDAARCKQHVVDFDQNFAGDLASNVYRYMWITPNMCDDMHNCPAATADAFLEKTITQIQASDGYKNGGAIFILFDEGNSRLPGATAPLPVLVVSPNIVSPGYTSATAFNHTSYLATVEDIFGLERLPTTASSASMDEFFTKSVVTAP